MDALLAPRSIAILGASEHGAGARVRESLSRLGFPGPVHLVNPGRPTVAGLPCHPAVSAIGEPVDLAVLALSARHVLPAVQECAEAGIPAAVVFAGGFAEAGTAGAESQARLSGLARAHGMSILGPNCMGYVRPPARRAVYLDHLWHAPRPGAVALVTQSGSVGVGALNHTGTLGLSAVVSVGNEAVVSAADVIDWLVTDESTRAIALFMEDTSRIGELLASAGRAADAGKRMVVCRAGRSAAGARAAQTHTGALATPDRALRAVLQAHGIAVVNDLDELCAAAEILASGRRVGRRLGGATVSGGHASLLHDLAADTGLGFPEPGPGQAAALEAALGEPRVLHNPLDAWADTDVAGGFGRALRVLRDSPGHDAFVVIVDAPEDPPTSDPELSMQFARSVAEAASGDDRLWVMATSAVAADDPRVTELAREAGCPRLAGLRTALASINAVAAARRTALPWRAQTTGPAGWQPPATEAAGYELMGRYGIRTPAFRICRDLPAAEAAAAEIGYPVVAKTHQPGLLHKTAAGGVVLDIGDATALSRACARLAGRFPGAEILVARRAGDGVDLLVGARHDRQVGPILLIGAGGTLAELIDDVAILPAPASPAAIRDALTGTRVQRLLDAGCGADSPGYAALVSAIGAAGNLIADIGVPGASIDINPLRITASEAVALDFAASLG
jgi:acetate---CoA ligase (ADP-forming)